MKRIILSVALAASVLAGIPAAAQQKVTIGVALPEDHNPFYIGMLRGIKARAGELGMEVVTVSSESDKARQINGVQDLVARGVKGILISPIDATAVNAAYDAAAAAKIPIISVGRGSTSSNQTLFVAMDEKQVGRDIATWTVQAIGGKGKIAVLSGPPGASTFRNVLEGFNEVVSKAPGISVAFNQAGPLSRERGLKQAEDALVANPDLVAIYGANDDVALGASQAVAAAGKKGKITITGMNGVPPGLRGVKEGAIGLTVELNPVTWGRLGVDVLAGYLKGEKFSQHVFIKHKLIDAKNIDANLPK